MTFFTPRNNKNIKQLIQAVEVEFSEIEENMALDKTQQYGYDFGLKKMICCWYWVYIPTVFTLFYK